MANACSFPFRFFKRTVLTLIPTTGVVLVILHFLLSSPPVLPPTLTPCGGKGQGCLQGTEGMSSSHVTESLMTEPLVSETHMIESHVTESSVTETHITKSRVTESHVTESLVTESYMTKPFVTKSHVTATHVTKSHVTATHVTKSQVTETHVTKSHVTESHVTKFYVTKSYVTTSHVTETHRTESHMTESHVTEPNMTKSHVTKSHVTRSHVTKSHVTERHVTERNLTKSHVTKPHVTESEEWRTVFYNVSAGMRQPLWSWPLDEGGRLVAARPITVLLVRVPSWLQPRVWRKELGVRRCPVACLFSSRPRLHASADAVVFYAVDFPPDPPPPDPPARYCLGVLQQTWLFLLLEAPPYAKGDNLDTAAWRHQLNWSVTYREDSDLWYPYGRFHPRHGDVQETHTRLSGKRRRMVAWVVSNCQALSRRGQYVQELGRHLRVDVFGACGSLSCGHRCVQTVGRHYRFYLALENCMCQDYVTEKVFRYMAQAGVIPVVMGGANYSRFLPPGSYIDTADFRSPRKLAQYLKRVAASPALQTAFLAWRGRWQLQPPLPPACQLCMRLLRPQAFPRSYPQPWHWFANTSSWSSTLGSPCGSPLEV